MTPQEQKAFFEDQGYLILEGLLTPEEALECQEEVKRLHDVAATPRVQRRSALSSGGAVLYTTLTRTGGAG